ncbi:MAG: cation:proton antiporter [Dehalococcoidia bacterium]
MDSSAHLVRDVGIALSLALAGGVVARRLRISPIIGYLAAGLIIGPFTPGYRADPRTLQQLADVGLIFLMFGVGLHFNVSELSATRRTAVPAALAQVLVVIVAAALLGGLAGLPASEAVVFGMAASISSTVVLVRVLEERGVMGSATGRTLIGWLIVQDLLTIAMLVFLPLLADGRGSGGGLAGAVATGAGALAFAALTLTVGTRLVPPVLRLVGRTGSRELFLLSVVCLSLGIALGAEIAGTSLALGAFLAGVTVSETEVSHRAASEVLPLRDAFAVLFFVSIGMLVNPASTELSPGLIAAALLAVIGVKGLASLGAAVLVRTSGRTALLAMAGLAQAGEFSFILAEAGRVNGLISPGTYQALLVAAVASITVNPMLVHLAELRGRALQDRSLWQRRDIERPAISESPAHPAEVVIIGAGRVGRLAGGALEMVGIPHHYVDASLDQVLSLQAAGRVAYWGDAGQADILRSAGVAQARLLLIAVPDLETARLATERARELRPEIVVVSRAHSLIELNLLAEVGATVTFIPEFEGAAAMIRDSLLRLGVAPDDVERATDLSRSREYERHEA